ncbi:LSU ribosomal protein L33p [[Mycoplasma] cavipharyngis]|uniref:50S ribosomal protein L33 n=1 Tax=[Mycoplasma] cavipharyngis TaxID=92757 RepID=UPI003704A206
MAIKRSIRLKCSDCQEINYLTKKNSKKHPDKLELNKYCKRCQKTSVHKETKRK